MSVRVGVGPSPHLWTVVKKMHLKTDLKAGKNTSARNRPDTAVLEKPLILDPGLLRKVDMTRLTRDRLLTIENLITTPKKTRTSAKPKEKSVKSLNKNKSRDGKIDGWVDDESSVIEELKLRKNSRVINTTFRVRSHVRKGLREVFSSPPQHVPLVSDKEPPKVKSPRVKDSAQVNRDKKTVEDVFGTLLVNENNVPSPCSTCGRSERPERLHAHPSVPQNKRSKLKDDQENTVIVQQKSSVTKPVAMKFRSGKTNGDKRLELEKSLKERQEVESPVLEQAKFPIHKDTKEQRKSMPLIRRETFKIERSSKPLLSVDKKTTATSPSPTRKSSISLIPAPRRNALPRTPEKQTPRAVSPVSIPVIPVPTNPPVVHSASPRRPRTITCYLCQKQFGTASYPLHEPQCLQKWHRENQALPVSQQQPEPTRPRDREDEAVWDNAWEAAQAAMVSCNRCSKTFLPHRLEAHQRVCPQNSPLKKASLPKQEYESDRDDNSERSDRSILLDGPTSIHCHICGRVFNKAAVDRHEQQCLKRWQLEHSSRDSSSSAPQSASSSPPSSSQSTPRRRLVVCYLCGRQFGSASITIHEPQCLRKWRQENDRLPSSQRRAEPHKPDIVYDSVTGHVDYQATEEAQWQCHLVQLVPCAKCGRTFNPDRVIVHEKCCKGPNKQ